MSDRTPLFGYIYIGGWEWEREIIIDIFCTSGSKNDKTQGSRVNDDDVCIPYTVHSSRYYAHQFQTSESCPHRPLSVWLGCL